MKIKILLLISFLFCFLEWGNNKAAFIFEIIYTIFIEKLSVGNFFHPIIFLSFISILIILTSLFANINIKLEKITVIFLTLLVLFFLLIGLLSIRYKIIISTLPFLYFSNLYFKQLRNQKKMLSN
ncbi:hypothetical protein SAMN05444337_1644 [Flavobacterium haoranii]|uniref:Uncharacterized protein n=1 Tax=Flavobacterium haoranii TaxID=683124 RepID=A0A1M6HTS4_9FLAO|nr:hypothetical protein SAMN05444337_1644 [Flavobacterium haoranii]